MEKARIKLQTDILMPFAGRGNSELISKIQCWITPRTYGRKDDLLRNLACVTNEGYPFALRSRDS